VLKPAKNIKGVAKMKMSKHRKRGKGTWSRGTEKFSAILKEDGKEFTYSRNIHNVIESLSEPPTE
jgi:hypothetical protein